MYWEELFHASPNAKVILTVRDNTEVWNRSMISFMKKESSKLGNPGSWLFNRFMELGWTSPKMLKMQQLTKVSFSLARCKLQLLTVFKGYQAVLLRAVPF